MRFKTFLNEATSKTGATTHLTHLEDYVIEQGKAGLQSFSDDVKKLTEFFSNKGKTEVVFKTDGCVHEDTILKTKDGDKTIIDIIENRRNGIRDNVLTYNFDENEDEYVEAEVPRTSMGDKEWYEIETENGSTIKLTEDHEVYVNGRGWVEAKDLKEGDDIKEISQSEKDR